MKFLKSIKKNALAASSWLALSWTKVLAIAVDPLDRVNRANNEANLPTTQASPQRIIINFINYALTFVALFFVISALYAGWQVPKPHRTRRAAAIMERSPWRDGAHRPPPHAA